MPQKDHVNVALIGQGFMGRTHSNAWGQVTKFFKPPLKPVMHTVFGQPEEKPEAFAANWGWQNFSTDWQKTVAVAGDRPGRHRHAELHARAGGQGRHRRRQARLLREAHRRHAGRGPRDGRGRQEGQGQDLRVVQLPPRARPWRWRTSWSSRARSARSATSAPSYLQDWADENVPLLWRFDKKLAGSGAHGDLNAHIIDMTRFVTGQEITEICGAIAETFIKERNVPGRPRPPAGSPRAPRALPRRARSRWTTRCCSWPASAAGRWPASRPPARPPATRTATASRSTAPRAR